mgnify:CR=1 FL=1|tara:strand:- start:904 stop:1536 length:633 start_codon:yes stop_codon:yes gene_type:complete
MVNFGEFYGSSNYGDLTNREGRKYCYYKVKMEGKFKETCKQVPMNTVSVYPFLGQTAYTGTGLSCSFVLEDVKVLETCRCAPEGTINCQEHLDEDGIFLGDQFANIYTPGFPGSYNFEWCSVYQLESCVDSLDCEGTRYTTIDEIKLGPFGGDKGSCRTPSGGHEDPVGLGNYGFGTADSTKCENSLMQALGDYWKKNVKCPIDGGANPI